MTNKVTVLDILLTLRNLEELLMDYVEEKTPELKAQYEKALEERVSETPETTLENVYAQLLYIEDAVHCLSKENALASLDAMVQYRQYFK